MNGWPLDDDREWSRVQDWRDDADSEHWLTEPEIDEDADEYGEAA